MYYAIENQTRKGFLMNRRRGNRKGFTLIEILVVVMIIVLLTSLIAPKMFKGLGKAKRDIAMSKMVILANGIEQFMLNCSRYPTTDEGLEALITPPSDLEESWSGPYVKKSDLLDVWKNPYQYEEEGSVNAGSYDIYSFAADGEVGGEGDSEDIYFE